jgi:probable rRNA maturation factor
MIFIDNRQDKVCVTEELEKTIEAVIQYTLKEEKVNMPCEVSVIFVDNDAIREINRENRNIDKSTDVLSFPMLEYPKASVFKEVYLDYNFHPSDLDEGDLILGDIVLSLEKVEEQRLAFGHSFLREAAYLTVHSVLHLLGYDHMEADEKNIMRRREEEILTNFSISR